jgi:quercetin dioxygenase-like cupin family protein
MKPSQKNRRELLLAGLGGLIAQLATSEAVAQDPARVMPRAYRVAFENDQIRVLDFVGRPGMGICGDGMHSHPAHLTIVMTDWQGVVSTPNSAPMPRQRKAGDVFWAEAETHKLENTGKANTRVLIVELKTPPKAKA